MKTYYLQGNQTMDCHMIDAVGEDGVYCKTEDAKAKLKRRDDFISTLLDIIEEAIGVTSTIELREKAEALR